MKINGREIILRRPPISPMELSVLQFVEEYGESTVEKVARSYDVDIRLIIDAINDLKKRGYDLVGLGYIISSS